MPVTYSIHEGLLLIEAVGIYLSADIIRQFLNGMNDPSCPPRVSLVLDVTRSESLPTRPTDEIRMVAEFLEPYAERIGGRCAVVAASDVHFGLSQLGAVYSERVGVAARVFRTREEAMEWLNASTARQE